MKAMRKSVFPILVLILCLIVFTANALVAGEHALWKQYMAKCVGTSSAFAFTQQEARAVGEELTYFGCEYIRFSFGNYQNGIILMVGMDNKTLTCDNWEKLDDNKLTNAILKFAFNWDNDTFQEYVDDAAITVEFNDGYSLMYWKSLYDDGWVLLDKNSELVKKGLSNDDLFEIIPKHTGK